MLDLHCHILPGVDDGPKSLEEALAVCKGISHVDIELKTYGHDQQLEERVIALVEAAGMQNQIVTMSLSRAMVAKMKRLRPGWTSWMRRPAMPGCGAGSAGRAAAMRPWSLARMAWST